jgi:hypothetical protein
MTTRIEKIKAMVDGFFPGISLERLSLDDSKFLLSEIERLKMINAKQYDKITTLLTCRIKTEEEWKERAEKAEAELLTLVGSSSKLVDRAEKAEAECVESLKLRCEEREVSEIFSKEISALRKAFEVQREALDLIYEMPNIMGMDADRAPKSAKTCWKVAGKALSKAEAILKGKS